MIRSCYEWASKDRWVLWRKPQGGDIHQAVGTEEHWHKYLMKLGLQRLEKCVKADERNGMGNQYSDT